MLLCAKGSILQIPVLQYHGKWLGVCEHPPVTGTKKGARIQCASSCCDKYVQAARVVCPEHPCTAVDAYPCRDSAVSQRHFSNPVDIGVLTPVSPAWDTAALCLSSWPAANFTQTLTLDTHASHHMLADSKPTVVKMILR